MRVLLAENNPGMARDISLMLTSVRMDVCTAEAGHPAIDMAHKDMVDVILASARLPDTSIRDMVGILQQRDLNIPVVAYSRAQLTDIQTDMASAGHDLIIGRLDRHDVAARLVKALGPARPAHAIIKIGPLTLDLFTRMLEYEGKAIHVTPREFEIAEFMALQKDRALNHNDFVGELSNMHPGYEGDVVRMHISNLRKKIMTATGGKNYIDTIAGKGFAMRDYEVPVPQRAFKKVFADKSVHKRGKSHSAQKARPKPGTLRLDI